MNNQIDIVLTWVDGNDPAWQKEKKRYDIRPSSINSGDERYRDWESLKYIFRGIEKFMPWIHRVYFVTWGHLPAWLNLNADKLRIINHKDYIPAKYLPTFNSNVLDLNMFRIEGLAEQYINFNDDTFVIKPTRPEDFFVHGKPRDMACISPQPIARDSIMNIELNNLEIINDYFSTKDIKKNWKKWINVKMYGIYAVRTAMFINFSTIIGIFVPHIPISHLKSVAAELWDKEFEAYDSTCMHKFRTKEDINDWLSREWQLMSGNFEPRSRYFGKMVSTKDIDEIRRTLWNSKYRMICINDGNIKNNEFLKLKEIINIELENLLPEKCSFEG